ncbi:CPBP family intramembrane glutamic endopeptidase [Lentiprolixibacter aurantiacus]|uniref:CPBP family intramembrane metalloprotease n=1 Tax=Lentiprolixibacter aurantiacus TaxID=2993939 RepID=A0AAE3MJJ4_9FLAO|nr:CPBP family intramembrane glutamic endopeptidase [Lentiprolixibacter aurantiacus]MCX2718029.1 CPBP family intramembrane metalloprotease [Lentiprolixibacter aurantiacus]
MNKVNKLKSFIALSIIVFIPFGLMLWIRNHQSTGFASIELITYPLLFGGLSITILILLKKYFLKEKLADLNSGLGNWTTDIVWGILLTLIYFGLFYIERLTLANILEFNSNVELLGLMLDMRESPLLLLIWFGPVLWIGIALYEELIRVFLLTSLWKWSEHIIWNLLVILLSAIIIGLAHWSQGPYGVVTIGIKGLVSGYFFYSKKRLMPLVYAHVLYDGIQVALLLLTYPDP